MSRRLHKPTNTQTEEATPDINQMCTYSTQKESAFGHPGPVHNAKAIQPSVVEQMDAARLAPVFIVKPAQSTVVATTDKSKHHGGTKVLRTGSRVVIRLAGVPWTTNLA